MSQISRIYARYQESLEWALDDFRVQRQSALEAVRQFYPFLRRLIMPYGTWFRNRALRRKMLQNLQRYFGDGEAHLPFAAIDGTGNKRELADMMVFYGAAYAQMGEVRIRSQSERISYRRWDPSEDTSFVAYLPIPLNALSDLQGEWLFRADDHERTATVAIHTQLMQLAEIYLAYRLLKQERPPKILLLDQNLSSLYLSTDVMHLVHAYRADRATLGWIGAYIPVWGRTFEPLDALVAHAHPMHSGLRVPSARSNALLEYVVAEMSGYWRIGQPGERQIGKDVTLDPQMFVGITVEDLVKRLKRLQQDFPFYKIEPLAHGLRLHPFVPRGQPTLRQRWRDLQRLFEDICEQLFRSRRLDALQLQYREGSRQGRKWMDSNDVRFLIGVGLRLLLELAWEKRVLLIGVAKDSAARYFFKNFLSVMAVTKWIEVPSNLRLPGSDRLIAEMLPLVDKNLEAPWSTLEYDAVFMTVRALVDPKVGHPVIQGVRGDVVVPSDGLFARSLIHLFLERRPHKRSPLMGHVLFMDRLAHPYFDKQHRSAQPIETRTSRIYPLFWRDAQDPNPLQAMSVLVADLLTRNLFPEAIGQPDPLHRADLGAKALGQRIQALIDDSIHRFRTNPLAWRFRDYRDRR